MITSIKQAKAKLALYGCTLTARDGEYKVRLKGSPAGSGYFTTDLNDAVESGATMAKREQVRAQQAAAEVNKFDGAPLVPGYTSDSAQRLQAAMRNNNNPPITEVATVIVEQPARKDFCVAAISTNANSFGLHGCILVARDGEAWQVGHCQCSPPESAWRVGQVLSFPLNRVTTDKDYYIPQFTDCEIPNRLSVASPDVALQVWSRAES